MKNTAFIAWGTVRHTRLKPARHAFQYPSGFLYLPMRSLSHVANTQGLAINRRAWISFYDVDHGDGRDSRSGGAVAWVDEILAAAGIEAQGELWLQTLPRVAGYVFKPVSFWYAYSGDTLVAILAEVNNTFGERHVYLIPNAQWGKEVTAAKVFHVSPFNAVRGQYRFRFMKTAGQNPRLLARVDYDDDGPLLETSWSGTLTPMNHQSLRQLALRFPLMTVSVMGRILWNALKLYLKGLPIKAKPQPPETSISLAQMDSAR